MAKRKSSSVPMIDKSWEARDAMNTLMRAQEIQKNKSLMRRVEAEAKKQIKVTSQIIKKK